MDLIFHLEYSVSLLCVVVALVLFFAHREQSLSPKILSLYFCCISYNVFMQALIRHGDIIHFPHLWRTGVFVGMLNPGLAFIYVRSVLEQRYWFRNSDVLLVSLSVLLALTFAEFFVQPADVKKMVIVPALANRALYLQENEGLLPPGLSLMIRIIFGNGMAIAQAVLLFRWGVHTRPRLPDNAQNRSIFRWLIFLTSAIIFTFFLTSVQSLFQFFLEENFYWITCYTVMLGVAGALAYLIFRPSILYGLHGWIMPVATEELSTASSSTTKQLPKRSVISIDLGENIRAKLDNYLIDSKPFLKQGYRIADMASDIDVPLYQLSGFINQQYGLSFNELVNGYRIQYISDVLLKEPGSEQFTLEGIGKKAGFNSRGTFISAVKKKTGKTPSVFFKFKE